ncbi:MAG: carboxypeptidase-like regulatory domain-containing protein [Longimicrobiales bacterium]
MSITTTPPSVVRTSPALPALLAAALTAAPLAAQTVQGRVTEEATRTPVFGADVVVLDAAGRVTDRSTTDVTGGFLVDVPDGPTFRLQVRHIGYHPYTSGPVDRPVADIRVEVRLGVDAIALEPLTVTAGRSAAAANLEGFERRRNDPGRVGGVFVTRRDVESRPMATPTQLVVGAAGVNVQPVITSDNVFGLDRSLIYLRDTRGQQCLANVFVDGTRLRQSVDHTVDDILDNGLVGGVEVYARALTAPVEYQVDADCGVVLFWTHREAGEGTWSGRRIALGGGLLVGLVLGGLMVIN